MTRPPTAADARLAALSDVARRLARDVREARTLRNMSVADFAAQVGISASAVRRIENGETGNCRGDTFFALAVWAGHRGITEFAGFRVKPEGVAPSEWGAHFEALARGGA